MPKAPKKNTEGRVNVPLYERKNDLASIADRVGTTETNLARVLILDGLDRLSSGEIVFRGPTVTQPEPA